MRFALLLLLLICYSAHGQNPSIVQRGKKFVYKGEDKTFRTRYDSIRDFSEGRAAVCKDGLWGYINERGTVVVPLRFYSVMNMRNGLAGVKTDRTKNWSLINKNGHVISKPILDTVFYLDSLALGAHFVMFEKADTVYSVYHYYWHSAAYENVYRIKRYDTLYLLTFRDRIITAKSKPRMQLANLRVQSRTILFMPVDSVLQKDRIVNGIEYSQQQIVLKNGRISQPFDKIEKDTMGFREIITWRYHGIINSRLDVVIPVMHDDIVYTYGQFLVRDTNRLAWYDTNGRQVTPAYDTMIFIGDGIVSVKNKSDSTCTIINSRGEIISREYGQAYTYHSGLSRVLNVSRTQFAFIDTNGKVISKWYPCATDFHQVDGPKDYAAYKKSFHGRTYMSSGSGDENAGLMIFRIFMGIATVGASEIILAPNSGTGKGVPIEPMTEEEYNDCYFGYYSYNYGSDFQDGYSFYTISRPARTPNIYSETNVYYGLLDSTGKEITKAEYISIKALDTFFVIQKTTGYGIMTRSGKVILQPLYGKITIVRDTYFKIERGPMYWFQSALFYYDGTKGQLLTAFRYSEILDGGENTFILKEYGDYGYADNYGKFFIPMKYESAEPFHNGKARVRYSYKQNWFFIDKSGKKVE